MKLRHAVLFGFADSADRAAIADVVRRFASLQTSVPSIDAFESGQNCNPESLHQEHTHAFVPTLSSGRPPTPISSTRSTWRSPIGSGPFSLRRRL